MHSPPKWIEQTPVRPVVAPATRTEDRSAPEPLVKGATPVARVPVLAPPVTPTIRATPAEMPKVPLQTPKVREDAPGIIQKPPAPVVETVKPKGRKPVAFVQPPIAAETKKPTLAGPVSVPIAKTPTAVEKTPGVGETKPAQTATIGRTPAQKAPTIAEKTPTNRETAPASPASTPTVTRRPATVSVMPAVTEPPRPAVSLPSVMARPVTASFMMRSKFVYRIEQKTI